MTIDLEELERAARAATQGEWRATPRGFISVDRRSFILAYDFSLDGTWFDSKANADFIAKANPAAILGLIAELKQLRQEGRPSSIPCARCNGHCIEFAVPSDIWNAVIRPDGKERNDEYLCEACWHDALRAHMAAIESQNQGWISIAERLPQENQAVALINVDGFENIWFERHIYDMGYLSRHAIEHGYWSIRGRPGMCLDAYTHWMPLPNPPQSKEEE